MTLWALAVASTVTVVQRAVIVRRQALADRAARRPMSTAERARDGRRVPARLAARRAAARARRAAGCSTASPTRSWRRRGAGWCSCERNLARAAPGPRRRRRMRALSRDGDAVLPALLGARRSGCRAGRPTTCWTGSSCTTPTGCSTRTPRAAGWWRRCRTPATGTWPAPGRAPPACRSRRWPSGCGPRASTSTSSPTGRSLGHGGAAAHRRRRDVPACWSSGCGRAGSCRCSPTATCPGTVSRSTCWASRPACRPARPGWPSSPARRCCRSRATTSRPAPTGRPGCTCGCTRTSPPRPGRAGAVAMTAGRRRRVHRADPGAPGRLAHAAAGCSSPTCRSRPGGGAMRVGLVCPYSLDVPGGVQNHVCELAEALIGLGHHVSVLAPAAGEVACPPYVVAAGRAVAGAVQRLGRPALVRAAGRWPGCGAGSRKATSTCCTCTSRPRPACRCWRLWVAEVPTVATFHTAMDGTGRGRWRRPPGCCARRSSASPRRIAVSQPGRADHAPAPGRHRPGDPERALGGPVRPGLARRVDGPAHAARSSVAPTSRARGSRCCSTRRRGCWPPCPDLRLLVAGHGDADRVRERVRRRLRADRAQRVDVLGAVDDATRAALLADADVFVAPHTGGESFGVVLAEAMAAGRRGRRQRPAGVRRHARDGRTGVLFRAGDADDLAGSVLALLRDATGAPRLAPGRRSTSVASTGPWSSSEVLDVYAGRCWPARTSAFRPERGVPVR